MAVTARRLAYSEWVPAIVCDIALTYWNRVRRSYQPLPDGLPVLVRDADPVTADDTLGRGIVSGGQGRVHIEIEPHATAELRPEIYFEIRFGAAVIDLRTGTLEIATEVDTDAEILPLPAVWTSRNRYTVGYQRGLWTHFAGGRLGTPDDPIEFRLTFDAFVRFVQWSEAAGDFVPGPEGAPVRLCEHDLTGHVVLARGRLDDRGRALLSTAADHEHQPDLSLEVDLPEGTWSSRDHFAQHSLTDRGFWEDHVGTRIGRWGSPYTFDLDPFTPRRIPGNRVRPLIDGPAIYEAMRRGIEQAERSIHVEVMLLFADPYGSKICELLRARARAGVEVRLMVDIKTTSSSHQLARLKEIWTRTARRLDDEQREAMLDSLAQEREAERVRGQIDALVEPLRAETSVTVIDSSFPYVEVAPRPDGEEPAAYRELREQLPFFTIARIDHRKLMIFDGRRALMGGANIGQEYLYERPFDPQVPAAQEEWAKWHDCFVEIEGPAVGVLQSRFRERWVAEGGDAFDRGARTDPDAPDDHPYYPHFLDEPPNARVEGSSVTILDTTPGARLHVHEQLLALMTQARREIWIENPYFSSREVLHRLCEAARRGVRVVCVFPDEHNDSWDFLYAARLKYPALIEAGVEVYEYNNHMTHAKVAVIDDDTLIGSANLNHASFFNHYELVTVIHDAEVTVQFVRDMFERDVEYSHRIAADDVEGLLDIKDWVRPYLRWVVDVWF